MRKTSLLIPLILVIIILSLLAVPALADLGGQEQSLSPGGTASEINMDPQGILWVSDYGSGEIWRITPATGGLNVYTVGGAPLDARHDGLGNLWWADAYTGQVGRVSTSGGAGKLWQTPATGGLYGTGLDGNNTFWAADFAGSFLYNIIPNDNKVCTYELPDFMRSDYLAVSGDFAWLGDSENGRIARLQISNSNLTTWDLGAGSYPEGVALDEVGNPWWADKLQGELGYLNVGTNQVFTYTQSVVPSPQMLSFNSGQVWFTGQATFGVLNPATAAKTMTPVTPAQPVKLKVTCPQVLPADSAPIAVTTPQPNWGSLVYPKILDQGGWQVFGLPTQANAWGIAALSDVWVVDQGRQKLVRASPGAPAIRVSKTPNLLSVPETGANVTFTFNVTNTGTVSAVTITGLSDSLFGTLTGDADCMVGTTLAASAACQFSIARWVAGDFSGPPHTNTFTAQVANANQASVSVQSSATISFANVPPSIAVTKTANPTAVPETGTDVVFTFIVKNNSPGEAATITSLSDSLYGTLTGDSDCMVGTQLPAGASCQFSITRWIAVQKGGPDHYDLFTAQVVDNDGSTTSASDGETVTRAIPQTSIFVLKTANPTMVPETGGNVQFTFSVENDGLQDLTITGLSDSVYGTLAGDADCQVNTVLVSGASCQFAITRWVEGDFSGPEHVDVFTAQAKNSQNVSVSDTDDAVVDFSAVAPSILATKTANPSSAPDGTVEVTFTFTVQNTSTNEAVTILSLLDSVYGTLQGDADCQVGTVLAAGASCQFTIVRQVSGSSADPPHVNVFTAIAEDNDGTDATGTDDATLTFTGPGPSIQVNKNPVPAAVPETGGDVVFTFMVKNTSSSVVVTVTSLVDSLYGTLTGDADCKVGTVLAAGVSCIFSITRWVEGDHSGPYHTNTFTAHAVDAAQKDVSASKAALVSFTNVLPTLQATKTANPTVVPETGGEVTFSFNVKNTSSKEQVIITSLSDSVFGTLAGDADCMVGTVLAAGATCEFSTLRTIKGDFSGPDHINAFTAKARDNDNSEATGTDNAVVDFTNVAPSVLATKTAAPTVVPETGGNVTFTFTVQNTSAGEPATITSLADSVYEVLEGDADCAVNTVLAAGASCQFSITRLVQGDFSGPDHVNVFTAQVKDNENQVVSSSEDAVVGFTNSPPALLALKIADPSIVPENGGIVTFRFVIQNISATEPVTLTSLSDSVYGTLAGDGDCQVGTILAPGALCQFSILRLVRGDYSGPAHSDSFIVQAKDNENSTGYATDDAVVEFSNSTPTILVTKAANPTSVPDSGGWVTFTYTVTNTSDNEPLTITSLSDDQFGTLAGDGDCQVNTVLAPWTSCEFTLVRRMAGSAGSAQTNRFTAKATDNEALVATASAEATVTFFAGPPLKYLYLPLVVR